MSRFIAKTFARLTLFSGLLLSSSTSAQNFAIDEYVVSGGGGASTSLTLKLTGTVGQPATDTLAGGSYQLQGGFWSVVTALQTPGGPRLDITQGMTSKASYIILNWDVTAEAYVLEVSDTTVPLSWAPFPLTPFINGSRQEVRFRPIAGSLLFRLRKID